jgi:hypothetical protein
MSTGDHQCPWCGIWNPVPGHDWNCAYRLPLQSRTWTVGHIDTLPPPLTADDVRRIIREELARINNTPTE